MSQNWFLIYTKPRKEDLAHKNLNNQGFSTYLPLLEKLKRKRNRNALSIEPLFPRYLFIQLNLGLDNISSIRSTPGVSKLVSFGQYPTKLPNGFIECLRNSEDAQRKVHISDENQIRLGDTVEIMDGPFAGYISKIHAISGKDRVQILMDILGSHNTIELNTDCIKIY